MNTLLKKLVFSIPVFFTTLLLVSAEECKLEEDTQTTDNRVLSCHATNQTTTTFSYPKVGRTEVYKNSLCKIECNENIVLSIDSAKNVRAGMGFNYPMYVAAQRICVATYTVEKYDADLRSLLASRDAVPMGSAQYTNFVNQISNQLQIKDECDNWKTTSGKYNINPNISLDIETSQNVVNIPYIYKEIDPYVPVFKEEKTPYVSCDLQDNPRGSCIANNDTVERWTEIARIDGKYTMNDKYIELYSGDVSEILSDKTCKAGDTYFTSFYELTKPITGDLTDKGYFLKLKVNNLGNNIKAAGDKWSLNVDCWYALKNVLFPQGAGGVGSTEDEFFAKYGGTGFMYRTIDLETPFPNREPGENWYGKEELIVDTSSVIRDKVLFEINLNASYIRKTIEFNKRNSYDTFDYDEDQKSKWIEANTNIVKRNGSQISEYDKYIQSKNKTKETKKETTKETTKDKYIQNKTKETTTDKKK